ncbi:SH3KBP1-binding protein 1 [Oopsacas minuta]|uniref:SH3KBP1-binding protein 1 n=1 Tax=Oopsacas minuta TaxID=111878 RepID=A0AAV7JVK8_9METZ|nr:SH3KBP1-binding protein 1 [Oopsacas minuta]
MESKVDIVQLNVGGRRFTTSKQTLTWIPESFFVSLLSGRIPSMRDEIGAIFIDRDPDMFEIILHFMRTKEVNPKGHNIRNLRTEAEYYGLQPLVIRLNLCDELERSLCGDILFSGIMHPQDFTTDQESTLSVQSSSTDSSSMVLTMTSCGNWVGVAYIHHICCYSLEESMGWQRSFYSPLLSKPPEKITLNTKGHLMLAASFGNEIKLWNCKPQAQQVEIGTFDLKSPVSALFFIGPQLVAISSVGKVGVWHYSNQNWTAQGVYEITSYTSVGSLLVWGSSNGIINSIDVQKFPLRMSDNDLLIVELFNDPLHEPPTAMSVFGNPGAGNVRNSWSDVESIGRWLEVAYGTTSGKIRIVVQHPENFGHGFQIVQTLTVHTSQIYTMFLGEKHLISVCADLHVRTWKLTRFRGRLATQPGPTPLASYRLLSLDAAVCTPLCSFQGPFGELDNQQVFLQKVVPDTNTLFVRLSSTGARVSKIQSVDNSNITAYYVHECEALGRLGYRPRKFVFTGHINGSVQLWDLTHTLNSLSENTTDMTEGGPKQSELLDLLKHCDLSTSRSSSRVTSVNPSPSPSVLSVRFPQLRPSIPITVNTHSPLLRRTASLHSITTLNSYLRQPYLLTRTDSSSNSSIYTDEHEFTLGDGISQIVTPSPLEPIYSQDNNSPLTENNTPTAQPHFNLFIQDKPDADV